MLVLGIDTATKVAAVGLASEDKLIGEMYLHTDSNHSEKLMPLIEDLLSTCKVDVKQLTGVAVTRGPGSFTGLRIGLAIAKGLAQTLNIPIVGIPTLDGLSHKVIGFNGIVCPILDARKGEVYTCLYQGERDSFEKITSYMALTPEKLVDLLNEYNQPVYFLGDAVPVYREKLAELLAKKQAYFSPQPNSLPTGGQIAWLGKNLILKGEIDDIYQLAPLYIRLSEAETQLSTKKRKCTKSE